ncbi:DUF3110 domain-containing protein [Geminocystis sp.]|uniref:DUF3110 domain-containing protein n=1 Tax=Geminocystis sp. TaxID=2664100 RepID=UPI0035936529
MRIYVLLYNSGTANEGIHTLNIGDQDFILMFESEDDAIRYGILLEAQDFLTPSVESLEREEIEDFCLASGYQWKFISDGMLEIPPENNVTQTDWNEDSVYSPLPEKTEAEMSAFELERIRRQLEGLL